MSKKNIFTLTERIKFAMNYAGGGNAPFSQTGLAKQVNVLIQKHTGRNGNVKPQTIQSILSRRSGQSSYLPYIAEACGVDSNWLLNESRDVLDGAESDHAVILGIREKMGYKQNTMSLPALECSGQSVSINPDRQEFQAVDGLSSLIRLYLTMSPHKQKLVLDLAQELHKS